MMNNTNPTLILFDIDCTLLLSGGAGRAATRHAMLEVFGTESQLGNHEFSGKTDWQTLVELLHETGHDESSIGEYMPIYRQAMERHLTRLIGEFAVRPCPGALELVAALRQRDDVLLGIVTGNVSTTAPIKLRAAGFDPEWFPIGAYGDEAMSRNQLPFIALERARQHYRHPIEPEHVVVVGDTPMDVECARALGAVAVIVGTGFCTREELDAARPDYFLEDLSEFGRVLSV